MRLNVFIEARGRSLLASSSPYGPNLKAADFFQRIFRGRF